MILAAPTAHTPLVWVLILCNWLKVNVDAALSDHRVALAAVAQNHKGEVIKAWAKLQNPYSFLQADEVTISWVVHLARTKAWSHIMVEVYYSKTYFDHLLVDVTPVDAVVEPGIYL